MKTTKSKKSKYYQLDDLLSYNYKINLINGDRFDGKTTAVQKYALKRAIQSRCKSQFAVFCKYKDDIDDLCSTYFTNTMLLYPDYSVRFQKDKFYLKKKNSDIEKVCGYAFAINRATKKKSTSYPFIDTIIVEEYLNLEGNYIKRINRPLLEVELFTSLFETIARGKGEQIRQNVKAFLISNNYYISNPYFTYYDLINKVASEPDKRFYFNKKYSVAMEVTHNKVRSGIVKEDFDGSKFIDLQHEIKLLQNYKVNKIYYQITTDNISYINMSLCNNSLYIYSNGKNKADKKAIKITTSEIARLNYININLFKTFDIAKKIKRLFLLNELYYDSYETYIKFKQIMEQL